MIPVFGGLILGALCLAAPPRRSPASDHQDGPTAVENPAADITDVYAWMDSNKTRINLIMNVHPDADETSWFSNDHYYVFHTVSSTKYGETLSRKSVDIICAFSSNREIACWAGSEYVTGDPSNGLTSDTGRLKVFAGRRQDPGSFNAAAWQTFYNALTERRSDLLATADAAGCPQIDGESSTALLDLLKSDPGSGAPVNAFAERNVLSLVLSVSKDIVTVGGPIVGVWGGVHLKPQE